MHKLFDELLALRDARKLPPVAQWHPEREGEIDIRIASDGSWWHEGTKIQRQAIVDLFATVLRYDERGYALVTPVERLSIRVDDCPFVAVDMEANGEGRTQRLLFTTNVGDYVMAGADNPLNVDNSGRPQILVRDGLLARLSRPVYYRLIDFGENIGERFLVYSDGAAFDLGATV